ncbi:MAG: iron-containing redox enzyme family protein [Silvibacterium sp.]
MTTTLTAPQELQNDSVGTSIPQTINGMIGDFMANLPDPKHLTSIERRGIIARYTSVLEANFIYWMTATYLAVQVDAARPIIIDNLTEEVRDAHPVMLRKFAIAAHAFPESMDCFAVDEDLTNMRLFLGKLSGVQSIAAMAFFEGFIQKFMPYLAELAAAQGSSEMEYTDVHGECDIAHTAGLFNALEKEMAVNPLPPDEDLFEGVILLRTLMHAIVFGRAYSIAA